MGTMFHNGQRYDFSIDPLNESYFDVFMNNVRNDEFY